ncbi:MAG: mechanosensitive ion channel protein MscS [Verrucomicrobiaceae bacterium]|nr:mechanosensitive ion channel protein MscS [Verrucomicrobiaceae bacterium]
MDIENIFVKSSDPLLTFFIASLIALLVGFLVQWLGRLILLRITKRLSFADSLVRSTIRPMQLVMPLIFFQIVLLAAPDDWHFMPRVRHITGLIFIVAMTWLVIRCISGVAETILFLRPVAQADNLHARSIQTQTNVIARTLMGLAGIIGIASMLMTFPAIRALGASLLASAGLAGIVAGLAARPVLGNLIAGLQIALSQPFRLDDVVIVEGEWGRVEEITGTYVVIALWDQRRLVIPLQWMIEHPFQNWTRKSSQIMGSVFLWVDYGMPLEPLRVELERICQNAPEWDGRVKVLQTTDTSETAVQLRALVTSEDSSKNWDLRCKVREGLVAFMQINYPQYLPRNRADLSQLDLSGGNGRERANEKFSSAEPVSVAATVNADNANLQDARAAKNLEKPKR